MEKDMVKNTMMIVFQSTFMHKISTQNLNTLFIAVAADSFDWMLYSYITTFCQSEILHVKLCKGIIYLKPCAI